MHAAQAALCAGDQGRFLEYQDALFRAWREEDVAAYDDMYNLVDTDFNGVAVTVFADAIAQVEGIMLGSKSSRRNF